MSRFWLALSLISALAFIPGAAHSKAPAGLAAVAPTPPMGWNSYDYYNWTVNESEVMANADWLAKHLKPYGWRYVVVDFLWFKPFRGDYSLTQFKDGKPLYRLSMDSYGRLLPDPARFPSAAGGAGFKPLADRVHALGLKFGIHVMRGIPRQAVLDKTPVLGTSVTADQVANTASTCAWDDQMYGLDMSKPGAQAYLDSILKAYAAWGVDFIKVDDILNPYHKDEIAGYHAAILHSGRPIVLSLSLGPEPLSEAGFLDENANMWRLSSDVWDDWRSIRSDFRLAEIWQGHSHDGNWPDLDMLPLGKIGARYGRTANIQKDVGRYSKLTHDEQRTMMTLWSIYRSPLMIGANLPDNDAWTTSLFTNRAVIEVNQHSRNNRLIRGGDLPVYAADAASGQDKYLALFNTTAATATSSVALADLGIRATIPTDLWTGKKLPEAQGTIFASLPAHSSVLYRLHVR
ncbi:MAG TPA: hypothetical protein VN661_02545 [Candidatus Acidoferrales bacterium]|nr:hypothetical protein [Candidatus Acidoferrales bacterium]